MIFITDENISDRLARMLDLFDQDNEIHPLSDYHDKGTEDIVWMKSLSEWEESPVIVGGDGRILKNNAEKKIFKESNFTYFLLKSGWLHLPWEVFAYKMIKVWPDIVKNISRATYPMLFEVSPQLKIVSHGRVSRL